MINSKEESSPFRVSRPSGHSRKLSRVLLRHGIETAFAAELNVSSRIVGNSYLKTPNGRVPRHS